MASHQESLAGAGEVICLFTDVSDECWGVVVTKLPVSDLGKPLSGQRHEFVASNGGEFAGRVVRRPAVEKEVHAIVEGSKWLVYVLGHMERFKICTDRSLSGIFNLKEGTDEGIFRRAGRMQRWYRALSQFDVDMVHVPGSKDEWRGMLPHWRALSRAMASARVAAAQEVVG